MHIDGRYHVLVVFVSCRNCASSRHDPTFIVQQNNLLFLGWPKMFPNAQHSSHAKEQHREECVNKVLRLEVLNGQKVFRRVIVHQKGVTRSARAVDLNGGPIVRPGRRFWIERCQTVDILVEQIFASVFAPY